MSDPAGFSVARLRALPVILLADTSGSMAENGKIGALNRAVSEMIAALSTDADSPAEIQLAVITFGGISARVHQPLRAVGDVKWTPMAAEGKTPLGLALKHLGAVVNDETQMRRNAYYPTLVLLSDGRPTDDWREALEEFLNSERGRKTVRVSVGIGADADEEVLRAFASDPVNGVLRADQARQIHTFFRWLTTTVASRTRAPSPNRAPVLPPPSLEDIEF